VGSEICRKVGISEAASYKFAQEVWIGNKVPIEFVN
jgi:hypothetical protein